MKLLEFLDKYPPNVIRLAAHKRNSPLTDRQISSASGLSTHTVWLVSHKRSWRGTTVDVASKFCAACGVDIVSRPGRRRFKEYVANSKFTHWQRNPKYYQRLMK